MSPTIQDHESVGGLMSAFAEIEARIDGQRRERCVLFADMVGFSDYVERRGDAAGRLRVLKTQGTVVDLARRQNGRLVKALGDGWLLLFENATLAVQSAIEIQRWFANSPTGADESIRIRMGIDCGLLIEDSGDVFGEVVNLASRLAEACPKNSILASERLHDALGPYYQSRCRRLADIQLPGLSRAHSVHELDWRPEEPTRSSPVRDMRLDLEVIWDGDKSRIALSGPTDHESVLTSYQLKTLAIDEVEAASAAIHRIVDDSNRAGSAGDSQTELVELGRKLFDLLIPPSIAAQIRDSTVEHLRLKLDDACVHLPWELMHDGSDFLCCRFSLGRTVRTQQPNPPRRRPPPVEKATFLTLSNPTGDLPAATEEASDLYARFQSDPRIHFEWFNGHVPLKLFKGRLHQFDIVHYCGHSEWNSNCPDESGWVLSDGRFTAGDLIGTIGDGSAAPLLVFNNGCHGGATRSWSPAHSGLSHGLANAFLLAGCNHYIGAVSEILDRSSRSFSVHFYGEVFAGHPIGRAMREARLRLREEMKGQNLTWAQYVLYGDPERRLFAGVSRAFEHSSPGPSAVESLAASVGDSSEGILDAVRGMGRLLRAVVLLCLILLAGVIGAIALQPTDAPPSAEELSHRFGAAKTAWAEGRPEEARAHLDAILESSPTDGKLEQNVYRMLGHIAFSEGKTDEAQKWRKKAVSVQESEALPWAEQGVLLQRMGDLDSALAAFEKAASLAPDDVYILALSRGCRDMIRRRNDEEGLARIQRGLDRLREISSSGVGGDRIIDPWTSRPVGIALLDLQTLGDPPSRFGEEDALLHQMEYEIFSTDRWFVVDREHLSEVLTELEIGASPLADVRMAPQVGRLFAARGFIVGSLTREGGRATLSLRFVDSETRLLRSMTTLSSTGELLSMAPQAVQAILDPLESDYAVQGRIVSATEAVRLNIGSNHGVKEGQRFEVFPPEPTPELSGTVTGLSPVAEVVVVETGIDDSICRSGQKGVDLTPGMRVRLTKSGAGDRPSRD